MSPVCILFSGNMCIATNHVFFFNSSLYLYKLGIAPQIQDLLGKVAFTGNASGHWTCLIIRLNLHSVSLAK